MKLLNVSEEVQEFCCSSCRDIPNICTHLRFAKKLSHTESYFYPPIENAKIFISLPLFYPDVSVSSVRCVKFCNSDPSVHLVQIYE